MPPPKEDHRSMLGDIGGVWARRKEIWALVPKRDRLSFAGAVGFMGVAVLVETSIPVLLGQIINRVETTSKSGIEVSGLIMKSLLLLAVAYVLKESFGFGRRWLVQRTTTRIERQMTVRVVGHLLKVDLGALARERVGTLHGRISRSVEGFTKFLKICFAEAFPAMLTVICAIAVGIWSDWRVGIFMSLIIPCAVVITVWQVSSQKGIRLALMQAKEGLDGTVVEQLGGLEYIRAANTHLLETARVEKAAESRRVRELKHHTAMAGFDWLKAVNENLFYVGIVGYAIILATRGEIPYGSVVTFTLLFQNVLRPLRDVHRILDETYETSLQVNVLMGMLQQPVDQSFHVATLRPPKLDGSVPLLECREVVVEYAAPDGSPRRVLDEMSLKIFQGQTIGVAGRSGSGKSTWLRTMLRLLHPSAGQVLVGGVPIEALSREDIGKSIGYVSQVPFVFTGTVRENVAYGCGTVTQEQVEQAARQAHIHDEILLMPQGYESPLTERGANLSGGQRQRLALARMFLKNPPVLILDEGTSALDNISERKVRAAIDEARKSHTVIMVAHRLSTLNETDCIFVFDEGRVVEQGSYDDLVRCQGVFAELVRSAEAG